MKKFFQALGEFFFGDDPPSEAKLEDTPKITALSVTPEVLTPEEIKSIDHKQDLTVLGDIVHQCLETIRTGGERRGLLAPFQDLQRSLEKTYHIIRAKTQCIEDLNALIAASVKFQNAPLQAENETLQLEKVKRQTQLDLKKLEKEIKDLEKDEPKKEENKSLDQLLDDFNKEDGSAKT